MAEMNGDDRTVDILDYESDTKTSSAMTMTMTMTMNDIISGLEQENLQLVHDKDVIEKRIVDLKQSIEKVNDEKVKLLQELHDSKSEIRILESVAARAAQLESEVSKLQHDLIITTSELEEVNRELTHVKSSFDGFKKSDNDKCNEFEAIAAERDLLVQKLEANETQYAIEMNDNDKDKEIENLKVKLEEFKAVIIGDDQKGIDDLKRELEVRVGELENKLEDKERAITGFEAMERETVVVEGKRGELLTREVNFGWPVIAGSTVCAVGFVGLVCYLHQAKRT